MALRREKKNEEAHNDRQYYKPHFGPEETQEIIDSMRQTEANKIAFQHSALIEQRNVNIEDAAAKADEEKVHDRARLEMVTQIQRQEDTMKRNKDYQNK